MSFTSYDETRPWARGIAKQVEARLMPPWHASPDQHGVFVNERTLTDAEIGTLVAWARAMGHSDAATLLQQTLDEEMAADKKLSGLAESGINRSAADAAHSDQEPARAGGGRKGAGSARAVRR